MVGADSYEAWGDYQTAIQRSEDSQLAIARATAEQTARMVQEIDVVLADQAAAPDRLRADVTRFPFVHSMELFDHNGHMLASTSATAHADVDYLSLIHISEPTRLLS